MAVNHKRLDEMVWYNIEKIRTMYDNDFARDVLESRRDFLNLRLRHEPALRKIYIDAADRIANELKGYQISGTSLTKNHKIALENSLRREAEVIAVSTTALMVEGFKKSVEFGSRPLDNYVIRIFKEVQAPMDFVKIQKGFGDVNTAAVEAFWNRTRKGLNLSDRIWKNSEEARKAIQEIIQNGIAQGRDVVKVARDLEKYVRDGAKTLAGDYPNMMRRMGSRVPKDLCYEALRLARNEYSIAYMEGTYIRGRTNPAYEGIQWMLSDAHEIFDICDHLADADLYGMGRGVYKKGDEPPHPHVQCMCFVVPVMKAREQFVHELAQWLDDPSSQPDIEQWYNEVYRP